MSNRAAGTLLAALVGLCGFLGWRIWVLTQDDFGVAPDIPTTTTLADAAPGFVTAWRANEEATYLTFATVGLAGNGVSAFTEDVVVRRNGMMLINRDSSIIFQRDGETETCRQTANELFCTPPEPIGSVEERVETVEALMVGPDARYQVNYAATAGCYDLKVDLSKGSVDPDFGLLSTYCFDGGTGALASRSVERVNRVETYETDGVSAQVRRSDLAELFPAALLDRFFE